MVRARIDPNVAAHLEWLGFIGPKGLVVSASALVSAGAYLERRDAEGQRLLLSCLAGAPEAGAEPRLADFRTFAERVLGWSFSPEYYAGTEEQPIPPELTLPLPDHGETLRPDFAVREPDPAEGASAWQLLVAVLDDGAGFDRAAAGPGRLEASPHGRMERLLRATRVPAGLIVNGEALRLLSAPYGETSGWLDFKVADMAQTAGRPISTALRLLLRETRLLTMPRPKRLSALLADSRRYQNDVSERLAEQVLHALYELLRGFQAAHDASGRELLRRPLAEHADEVYRALLTVILRLVFLLYAEERDLLPTDDGTFVGSYSLAGLYDRLREDAALHPDTMDQRFGAWAQLLALFRMIHDGARAADLDLPKRHGVLFDPDRFPFLEGRAGVRQVHERIEPPRVPDGTVYRALDQLLVLDGERISYRALDVEQIGSVYETMMGFRLETATGRSLAVKAQKTQGAPTAVDLEALLAEPPARREKWLRDRADRQLTPTAAQAVRGAATLDDLHAALEKLIDRAATPDLVPPGAMVLQPSEERRRSGSHYTPRSLTEPIVRTTLEPILARLRSADGRPPRPEQILDLKVLDPAMGSGAFLVEACRQLGEALVDSWRAHGETPAIPTDEDERIHAMRWVARRCLYGVDRNPVAVDLAKVSLWLATLAKDHPLTFVDHALRHGDSLVGLSRRQLEAFHWEESGDPVLRGFGLREALDRVRELREAIREAGEEDEDDEPRDLLDRADHELDKVRLYGDLVIAAFFDGAKPKDREAKLGAYFEEVRTGEAEQHRRWLAERRGDDPPLAPFHWEVEFPEVFGRGNPGFDAVVGNPPFAGRTTGVTANVAGYLPWLLMTHVDSHGNADFVVHFVRRAFVLIRSNGAFGLIATNTIAQGDTRSTGLRWICTHGGEIYRARKRVKWPGLAAVVVSVLHVMKGVFLGQKWLDDREVERITAFLFHRGGNGDPARLVANSGKSFQGCVVVGMGFTFDDTDSRGVATQLAEMRRLVEKDRRNQEVIFPYIGGEEVNTSPTQTHHRYVINFGERTEEECRRCWPALMAIVEQSVRPEREAALESSWSVDKAKRAGNWWQFSRTAQDLQAAITGLERVLVNSQVSAHLQFAFLPANLVFAHTTYVFPLPTHAAFCALQSRPHETWARFFGSSMKDDLRYTPSDCFETFPFPENWETHPALEAAGRAYYDFRAALMIANDEGLTKTYNRFHDPEERDPDLLELRRLHAAMDRAVLDAYGWTDVPTDCEFLLDYEIDEDDWSPRRKKPWRYRWPDDVRDEVLARLLDLNAARAREEQRSGAAAQAAGKAKAARKTRRPPQRSGGLFDS